MRAIIIHGTNGSPSGNWFPWLANELNRRGILASVPRMPTPENQSLQAWQKVVQRECEKFDSNTILLGHSLGAIFALRLLEMLDTPIFATVLVSPPGKEIGIREYDVLNSSFFQTPLNLSKIKENAGIILFFMGGNDPYVPQEQMLGLAKALEVKPTVVKNGGHLNSEAGYTSFPELLEALDYIIK